LVVAAGIVSPFVALAAFPERPIKLVVPFTAGGGTDIWARLYARKLSERLGQPVVVENRPGANTAIGANAVAKSPADGYTLLFTSSTHIQLPALYPNLPYNVINDFSIIGRLGTTGLLFVANPAVNAKNIREFVSKAKASGKFNLGTYAVGSAGAVFGQYLSQTEDLGIPVVPYKGESAAITDLVGGYIQGGFFSVAGVKPFIASGQLNALGTLSRTRSPSFPEVPTLPEQGFSKFDWPGVWLGIFAAANTPKEVLDRITGESKTVLRDPELRKTYLETDVVVDWREPSDFADDIRREMTVWEQLVRSLGVKVE
jgi:tripartite-type tricarboxylate transporter receptor subunit TctC